MSHYAFTSLMSLTCPEEQTKYACLFSAVGRMFSLVFREFACLIPRLGQEKVFSQLRLVMKYFLGPLIQVGQFSVTG